MKRYLYLLLILAALLPVTSCRRMVDAAREKIAVEAIEKIELHGLSGADLVLRVKNDTGYQLELNKATIDVYYQGSTVGRATLRDAVTVGRHTTKSVATVWDTQVTNPLTMLLAVAALKKQNLTPFSISFHVEGYGGPAPVNISRERVPLQDFLNAFGVSFQDVIKYVK